MSDTITLEGWQHEALKSRALLREQAKEIELLTRELRIVHDCVTSYSDNYPVDVFRPIEAQDVPKYHAAIRGAGLSVDRWSAKIIRHALVGIALALVEARQTEEAK
jgi:hypothetical protein